MNYLDQLPPDKQLEERDRLYRKVFSSADGQIVFTEILRTLFYFDVPQTEEHQILRNFATELIKTVMSSDEDALVKAMIGVKKE